MNNSLSKIQKAFHVFEILTKIGMIFCIVGASLCAVGGLCAAAWNSGGVVLSIFGTPITDEFRCGSYRELMAVMYSCVAFLVTEAVLLGFANRYLKAERLDGTPFSDKGADMLKKLGIRCIYLPIIAAVISSVIMVMLDVNVDLHVSNLPSVGTGIMLIITSVVFRYGAELEDKSITE